MNCINWTKTGLRLSSGIRTFFMPFFLSSAITADSFRVIQEQSMSFKGFGTGLPSGFRSNPARIGVRVADVESAWRACMLEGMEDVVWGWLRGVIASFIAVVSNHFQFQTIHVFVHLLCQCWGVWQFLFLTVGAAIMSSEDQTDSID